MRFAKISLVSAFVLAACAAQAQVTITLDNPNQTVTAPAAGSTTVNFTGTITIASGYSYSGAFIAFPFLVNSTSSDLITSFGTADPSLANNGGSTSGLLFTADVPSGTQAGDYGFLFNSSNPAVYQVTATNAASQSFTATSDFSITVGPAATPEPGSIALLASLGMTGAGFLARRRRARQSV